MLDCAVLCSVVLRCAVLGYAVLRCPALCYAVLHYPVLRCAVLCCVVLPCYDLQHIAQPFGNLKTGAASPHSPHRPSTIVEQSPQQCLRPVVLCTAHRTMQTCCRRTAAAMQTSPLLHTLWARGKPASGAVAKWSLTQVHSLYTWPAWQHQCNGVIHLSTISEALMQFTH